jgi:HSP20 family molecular chaperone IbpA
MSPYAGATLIHSVEHSYPIRSYQHLPVSRSAIGFEHLFDLLNSRTADDNENYPPYDIARTGEDTFRINVAVAGFAPPTSISPPSRTC